MATGIVGVVSRKKILSAAFVVACAFMIVFAARSVHDVMSWRHQSQTIQPWMTRHYIARSWDVNPEAVDKIVGLDPKDDDARTLQQVASERGVAVATLTAQVDAAIAKLKAMNHSGGQP